MQGGREFSTQPKYRAKNMPESVLVLGVTYTIEQSDAGIRQMVDNSVEGWLGISDHCMQRIILRECMEIGQVRQTLWHEIKHAINALVGLNKRGTSDDDEGKFNEEDYTTRTAPIELQVLRDNPMLVAFLLGVR